MRPFYGICVCLLAFGLLNACGSTQEESAPPKDYLKVVDSLFGMEDADFRMVSLGDSRENIPIGDGEQVLENEMERIVERVDVGDADSTYAEVFYLFRENRLTDAEINVFTRSDSVLKELMVVITDELKERFGESAHEKGFTYWSSLTRGKYPVEVFLADRTAEFGLPSLQIIFRAELIEEVRMAQK